MPDVINVSIAKEIEDLKGPIQPGAPPLYAATELVRELLLYHISSVGHESHVNLSGQVFSRSRKVYDAINQLMDKLNNLDTLEWDLFDRYTQAIPPLERILFSFIFKDPSKARKLIPDVDDITEGVGFIERWLQDRSMLFDALTNLRSSNFLVLSKETEKVLEEDYQSYCTRDDFATYSALAEFFTPFSDLQRLENKDIIDRKRGENHVSDVHSALQKFFKTIAKRPPVAALAEIVIKSLMLLSLPFSLLDRSGKKRDKLTQKAREHLSSARVWNEMKILLQHLANAVVAQPTQTVLDELDQKYQDLVKLLLSSGAITIETVNDMLELIKLSTKIRRPFHERTVALIKILRLLDEETVRAKTTAMGRRRLKDILQEAVTTLQKTQTVVADVKTFLLSGNEYLEQKAALSHLVSQTEDCCKTLKLPIDWATQQAKFNEGVEIDESHMNTLRTKFLGLKI